MKLDTSYCLGFKAPGLFGGSVRLARNRPFTIASPTHRTLHYVVAMVFRNGDFNVTKIILLGDFS